MTHYFTDHNIRTGSKIISLICICLLFSVTYAAGQISYSNVDGRTNAINTAVPFLRIAPDARSGAMGGVGIALSPDANAAFWNLSKLPFSEKSMGISASYTPWLREMANDVFLAYITGYKKLNDLEAVNLSLRYFDMGNIQLTDFKGEDQGRTHPREFSIDAGYSRKLSDHWSAGVALRFIHSDLATGVSREGGAYKAGTAVAGDLGVYYHSSSRADSAGKSQGWSFGATLTNLGTKIGYVSGDNSDKYFIPSNLGIGGAYTYRLNEKNSLTLALDINKLLVPTPDTMDKNNNNIPDYRQKSVVSALFGSFGDAPGGLKEEFHELMYSAGAEYWYDNLFAIRAGYYNEYKTKGDRKYVTVGFGLKYKMAGLDFSYLIPSGGEMQKSPLSNTLRISVSYTPAP